MIYKIEEMYKKQPSDFMWHKYYITWLTPQLKSKFYSIKFPEMDHLFYQAIRYQYGIDHPIDLKLAYQYYQKSGQLGHSMALYKLAEKHLIDWKQTGILDRDEQMYIRFKALSYLDPNDENNGIDLCMQLATHLDKQDPNLQKFNKVIQKFMLVKDPVEVSFVNARRHIKFYNDQNDILIGVSILENLVQKQFHLHSAYTLAIMYSSSKNQFLKKDTQKAEEYFRFCQAFGFYKAYYQFGKFLFENDRIQESCEIFKIGYQNGQFNCLFNYISFKFWNLDLKNLGFLELVLDLQLIDIITGNIYSIFEFIYIKKILRDRCPSYSNSYHDHIQKELVTVIKDFYHIQKEKQIKRKDQIITAYILIIRYGFITDDLAQQAKLIEEASQQTETKWLKRYCSRFLFRVRYLRCYGKNNIKKPQITNEDLEELKSTQNQMFYRFNTMLNNEQNSSYYYYFAKVHQNGWGTQKSISTSFFFLTKAIEWIQKKRLNVSFVQFFRAAKAKEKYKLQLQCQPIQTIKKKCYQQLLCQLKCEICFENAKTVLFFNCRHLSCKECYKSIVKIKNSCHMCRKQIKLIVDIGFFKQN